MFGIRIVTDRQIEKLVRDVGLDTAKACEDLARPRGHECGGDYGRGRTDAANDIRQLIKDL